MDKEKEDWFKEVGITKMERAWTHSKMLYGREMHYSTEYLEETPIEKLKAAHEKQLEFDREVQERESNKAPNGN